MSKPLTPAVKGDASTAGGAMETLGKPEWFTAPEPNKAKTSPLTQAEPLRRSPMCFTSAEFGVRVRIPE